VTDVELTDPHHVTAGYLGTPGSRTFFLQAEDETQRVSFLVEKGQVEGIAELLTQVLARVDDTPSTDWDRAAMELREPVDPLWRVGSISLGFDPDEGSFVLELSELVAEDDDPSQARIWLDRDQARRLAAHALEVVGQGRPRCELCGRPTEMDGSHVCPATNGHGELSR
jgi:uncharacterized repeat protein (TIGR03847 family)